MVNSTFLDNTEEYEMLKNAGLMRLIENDSLVVELETKYSIHGMYKNNEADITRINNEIERCYCGLTDLSVIHKYGGHFNDGIQRDKGLLTAIDLELPPEMTPLAEKDSFEEQFNRNNSK